ncbi:MAG: hypothetical protein A3F14_01435 [Gammaproteobacteria bacterium RIFCSPHIGHO2_12_FULL_43_28]|nr:MAG: hypothetical protein A3F14_01435 [Gammaproteobacteria bacterium RIFCSPHIGHO2_12_FULL_43_28]
MDELNALLSAALAENAILLTNDAKEKLIRYLHLLKKWNDAFNLTTILAPREMVYLHLIDSLAVLPYLKGRHMLDIGTGAGLPGIPLAIAAPQHEWVLLDKNSKKVRFLTQVIAELGLKNVQAVHTRCENFHPTAGFDTILSRAFGTIRLLLESTGHLLNSHGLFIAMKGKYPQTELLDLPEGFAQPECIRLAIKGINIERHLICLRRMS